MITKRDKRRRERRQRATLSLRVVEVEIESADPDRFAGALEAIITPPACPEWCGGDHCPHYTCSTSGGGWCEGCLDD
jgi:hypothetical protein